MDKIELLFKENEKLKELIFKIENKIINDINDNNFYEIKKK